jgi:hypothetical protein
VSVTRALLIERERAVDVPALILPLARDARQVYFWPANREGTGMDFLQYAKDKHEIGQVYILYCDLVDHKQFDGMTGVFTHDAVQDYSAAYNNIVKGVVPLIASMHANLGEGSNCGPTHHNVVNFRVSVDGDTAESRTHYYAVHKGLNAYEGQIYSMWGEYHDFWVRTPEGWRVDKRFYSIFLTEGPHQICGRP